MSQQKEGFPRDRLLTLILIIAVVIASIAFGFWIGTLSPRGVEKIYFGHFYWADDECMLSILNTGSRELIINEIWINGTLIDSTEWESFPSILFKPGDQGELYITPSSISFTQGTVYEFTVVTVAGNHFSHTAIAKSGFIFDELDEGSERDRLKEKLYFEHIFYSEDTLTVHLLNCGTIDGIKIKTVYIYDDSNNLKGIFSNPTLYAFESLEEIPGQVLDRGDEGRLVLNLSGSLGGFCNIKIVTERGAAFDQGFVA